MFINELKNKARIKYNQLKAKRLRKQNCISKYEIESYLENPNLWHEDVCKFLQYGDGNIEYFKNMYIGLKKYTNDEKYLKIQSLFHLCSDNYERIICYRFLMDLEILSSDDLRKYNEIIFKTKQIDMKYCLHLDVNGYVFRHKNCIYPEYYNDRRKTIKSLIDVYWDEEAIFRNVDNNRIAILTNFLGDSLAATTTYILDDSLALCNAGKEVEIFVAGHHFWKPKDAFLNMKTPLTDDFEKYAKELLQPDNNREAKPAGSSILVLNNLKTPAVLVECGFLSNPSEAKLLEEDTYQRKLAFIIYLAVNDCLRKH